MPNLGKRGRRNKKLEILMTEDEKEEVRRLAEKAKLGMSSFARFKIFSDFQVVQNMGTMKKILRIPPLPPRLTSKEAQLKKGLFRELTTVFKDGLSILSKYDYEEPSNIDEKAERTLEKMMSKSSQKPKKLLEPAGTIKKSQLGETK